MIELIDFLGDRLIGIWAYNAYSDSFASLHRQWCCTVLLPDPLRHIDTKPCATVHEALEEAKRIVDA